MTGKKKKTPARNQATAKKSVTKKAAAYKKGFECKACGYRLVIDRDCNCGEEHVILCCGQPMKNVKIAR
ncbi:MAG: hypothetical protein PHU81_07250 [Acidobacteriota bacterium]|nr:hypothetical protein [Acidobacteriota bacterium]